MNRCTCGVKFTGGQCSSWCDSLVKEQPFRHDHNPFFDNNMTNRARFIKDFPGSWEIAMKKAGLQAPWEFVKK